AAGGDVADLHWRNWSFLDQPDAALPAAAGRLIEIRSTFRRGSQGIAGAHAHASVAAAVEETANAANCLPEGHAGGDNVGYRQDRQAAATQIPDSRGHAREHRSIHDEAALRDADK